MRTILQPKDYDEWLNRHEIERPPVHLLRPFDSSAMFIRSAHPKVGNVGNQGPEMLNSKYASAETATSAAFSGSFVSSSRISLL
jgi:putative SOS response-associated peptidase YedK